MRKKPVKKKRKTVENDETCLHLHCAKWVKDTHPELLIFHVANERKAAVQYHVKLKRMGVMGGVADFLAFPANGAKVAIELKDDKGTQDADQIAFQKRWEHAGGVYHLVRTLAHFQNVVSALVLFS